MARDLNGHVSNGHVAGEGDRAVTAPDPERVQQTRKRERLKGRTEQNKRREGGKGRLQVSDLQAGEAGSAGTLIDSCTQKTAA